ncbi:MAG: hypothetical protein WAM14_16975 [Candidatus Nitrosopolaris sp.]
MVVYDDRENAIMANHVFLELCKLDEEDRRSNRDPQWRDIVSLADLVKAFDERIDVSYIAEEMLLDERHFIERDLHNANVRLTKLGRENCDKGIEIPPSDIQKLRKHLGEQ